MKNRYSYIILGQYIVRDYTWKVMRNFNRKIYVYGNEALWDRAEKYGFTKVDLS